ncbi:sugar ABC transporter permease [Tessaracoccus lubricantis]|uniref:Sugar ABC transporter permease n=1 Tax=Tessaracoccus lubricantis TaxID=545543 RepID=A0ABP9EZS9_9ACTN
MRTSAGAELLKRSTPLKAQSKAASRGYALLLFAAPALILYGLVMIYPTLKGAALAFTNSRGGGSYDFVYLDNFRRLLGDQAALGSIINTVVLTVSMVALQTGLALIIALGLHRPLKLRGALRTVFFLPFILPSLIVGVLWQFLYNPGGPVDTVLEGAGLGWVIKLWLGDTSVALWSVIVALIWQNVGFSIVIYLAGLEQIPRELFEAAAIDGATGWKTFWNVTRPLLGSATTINLTLTLVGALKIFDQIFVMTGGGPGYATEVLSLITYKQSFVLGNWGYGSAVALVLTMIVAAAAVIQIWARGRMENR